MRRLLFAAIVASMFVFPVLIGSASAARLSISDDYFEWKIRVAVRGQLVSATCPLTLTGFFHSRTIVKSLGSLVGYVLTATTASPCTPLLAVPWHLRYDGYEGMLPNITFVNYLIGGFRLRFESEGISCLMATTEAEPLGVRAALDSSGRVTSIAFDETDRIALGGGFPCEAVGPVTVEGRGTYVGTREAAVRETLV